MQTQLLMETWLWEKEQSHRLFNFHDGYRVVDKGSLDGQNGNDSNLMRCLGVKAAKRTECSIIGSHIIQKNGPNDILL